MVYVTLITSIINIIQQCDPHLFLTWQLSRKQLCKIKEATNGIKWRHGQQTLTQNYDKIRGGEVKGHVSVRPTRFYTFIHKEKVKASFTKCRALWGLKVLSKTTRENSSDEANWKWVFFFFFGILGFAGTQSITIYDSVWKWHFTLEGNWPLIHWTTSQESSVPFLGNSNFQRKTRFFWLKNGKNEEQTRHDSSEAKTRSPNEDEERHVLSSKPRQAQL